MKLQSRLLLHGALVPAILMIAGFVATGFLLKAHLVADTDRELMSQAAVESVSLFDGPIGGPHLHLERSPLSEQVQSFMPEGALYEDATGRRVVLTPGARYAPPTLRSKVADIEGTPIFSTVTRDHRTMRSLYVIVRSPSRERYVLWVGTPLDAVERTMDWYVKTTATIVLASVLISFLLQRRQATAIGTRLDRLAAHMARLRGGHFDAPASDPNGDVIADLRDAIAETTTRLRATRDAQERFVANAAHELRTPLTAMRTLLDTTLRRERSADELREALDTMRAEVERLTALSGDLLDRAALEQTAIARERVSAQGVVEDAIGSARPLAAQLGLTIVSSVEPTDLRVYVVRSEIRRALENLLSNAVKFAPRGSVVRVEVELRADRVRFLVTDEGDGVPEAEHDAIFEPFQRGRGVVARGAGLGLAIVRDIARRHGGDAWVEARPERPAGFAFDIPLAGGVE